MTSADVSLTGEELEELRNALEAHYHRLDGLYGRMPNSDWFARRQRLTELRTKLIQAGIKAEAT